MLRLSQLSPMETWVASCSTYAAPRCAVRHASSFAGTKEKRSPRISRTLLLPHLNESLDTLRSGQLANRPITLSPAVCQSLQLDRSEPCEPNTPYFDVVFQNRVAEFMKQRKVFRCLSVVLYFVTLSWLEPQKCTEVSCLTKHSVNVDPRVHHFGDINTLIEFLEWLVIVQSW